MSLTCPLAHCNWRTPCDTASVIHCTPRSKHHRGDRDEFTSEGQLEAMVAKSKSKETIETVIYRGCGHFELESPSYDEQVSQTLLAWIERKGLRSARQ